VKSNKLLCTTSYFQLRWGFQCRVSFISFLVRSFTLKLETFLNFPCISFPPQVWWDVSREYLLLLLLRLLSSSLNCQDGFLNRSPSDSYKKEKNIHLAFTFALYIIYSWASFSHNLWHSKRPREDVFIYLLTAPVNAQHSICLFSSLSNW